MRRMTPDFGKYDATQLRQVLGTIDCARFPERVEEIKARLAQLEHGEHLQPAASAEPVSMDRSRALPILRRVGALLIVIGLLDIATRIYFISGGALFVQFGAIFMVLAGVLLYRGGMRTASLVRWLAWTGLPALVFITIILLAIQPLDLTLTLLRLHPVTMLTSAALAIGYGVLLYWLARQLGRAPILAARIAAQRPLRDMRIPFALGVAAAIGSGALTVNLLGGARAGRAEAMVAEKLGAGYRYHVNALNVISSRSVTVVNASVVAWNPQTVVNVPVHWQE
jgi:hypothetical protein